MAPRIPVDSPTARDRTTAGHVPPANEPGHHPAVEQDKPIGRRPRNRRAVRRAGDQGVHGDHDDQRGGERFRFRFAGVPGWAARAVVIREERACIEVSDEDVVARFGPWVVRTARSNIAGVSITGPYAAWKVSGPPRLSLKDRGLTFATNGDRGVCVRFHEPVAGIEPTGRVRHPGLTVTVADPEALVAALAS